VIHVPSSATVNEIGIALASFNWEFTSYPRMIHVMRSDPGRS
jgi:hypothetical protein